MRMRAHARAGQGAIRHDDKRAEDWCEEQRREVEMRKYVWIAISCEGFLMSKHEALGPATLASRRARLDARLDPRFDARGNEFECKWTKEK